MSEQDRIKNVLAMALGRRQFLGATAGLAASGLPFQAFASEEAPAPKRGGILKVAAPSNPTSLDPYTGGGGLDHTHLYNIFDNLIEFEYDTLKPKPGLAKAWRFTDPQTFVMDLQPDVQFHDGTPCDAAAVKWNIDNGKNDARSNVKADFTTVASVEVTAPLQVTVKLNQPDTALPLILADRAGMMSSPTAVQALGKDHNRKPVGTGPHKLVSWVDNDRIVLRRNEKYWRPGRALPRRHRHGDHPGDRHRGALGPRRRERLRLLHVAAAEAADRSRQEPVGRERADRLLPVDLLQLLAAAVR